jgi:hypothetical protein
MRFVPSAIIVFVSVTMIAGCAWSVEVRDVKVIAYRFEKAFSLSPPASAGDFKCRVVRVGDSLSEWFSFTCDAAWYETVVQPHMTLATAADLNNPWKKSWSSDLAEGNLNAPKWWPKQPLRDLHQLYYLEKTDSSSRYVCIGRDKTTGRVFAASSIQQ